MNNTAKGLKHATHIWIWAVCIGSIAADQISKRIVSDATPIWSSAYAAIKATQNSQAAFSLDVPMLSTYMVAGTTMIALLYILITTDRHKLRAPIALVLAGGASNLIERVMYGHITDIIELVTLRFNLADLSIILGVAWSIGILIKAPQVNGANTDKAT